MVRLFSDEEIDEIDDDIAAARAKLKSAAAEDKDRFRKKIDKLKEKRKERITEFREKVRDEAAEVKTSVKDRKIAKLREDIEHKAKNTRLHLFNPILMGNRCFSRMKFTESFSTLTSSLPQGPRVNIVSSTLKNRKAT